MVRPDARRDADHLLCAGHLQVQVDVERFANQLNVAVLDMPPILAQVHGDLVCATEHGRVGRCDDFRKLLSTCLPQGGHVIDVDAESDHAGRIAARIPRGGERPPDERGASNMRIAAGRFKGRRLPEATGARPVGGRLKTSLFSLIEGDLQGARVLDLCAGVGGMGLEALSRGAGELVLVEHDPLAAEALRTWIEAIGCQDEARVLEGDAFGPLPAGTGFDIVFLDPPFPLWRGREPRELLEAACAHLVSDGLAVLKTPRQVEIEGDSRIQLLRRKVVGDAAYGVFLRL